jgi:hypothetical protein
LYNFSKVRKCCKVEENQFSVGSRAMARQKVYSAIVNAVKADRLVEPFGRKEFRSACPGLGDGTYQAFLDKHRRGNPGGNSELFEKVAPGKFRLIRPVKYGL